MTDLPSALPGSQVIAALALALVATGCGSETVPPTRGAPSAGSPALEDTGDTGIVGTDCYPTPPDPAEDCSNGRDDNGDGLLDCEDSDCFRDAACVETACDNGVDDDDDGSADCADDDCMGAVAHCDEDAIRVLRGRMVLTAKLEGWGWAGQAQTDWSDTARATSVGGDLRLFSASGAITTTCSWTVASAYVLQTNHQGRWWAYDNSCRGSAWSDEQLTPVVRTGFAIEAGCPVQSSGFLPERLAIRGPTAVRPGPRIGHAYASGDPWYSGPVVGSATYFGASQESAWATTVFTVSPLSN